MEKTNKNFYSSFTVKLEQEIIPSSKEDVQKAKCRGRKPKSLTMLYSTYDLEIIKNVIDKLSEEKQQLLFRAYGINLDKPKDTTGFTSLETKQLNYLVYKTIKNSLVKACKKEDKKAITVKELEKKTSLFIDNGIQLKEIGILSIEKNNNALVQEKPRHKFKEYQVTDNIESDFFDKFPQYKEITLRREKRILKSIKLAYYNDVEPDQQEIYIKYFGEVYPWFKEKMSSNMSEQEKNELIDEAINIALENRNHFIENNMRLIGSIANKYKHYNVPYVDLVHEGVFGMVKAIEKFDVTKGYKFSTYATWWIKQVIQRYICDTARVIRLPVHVIEFLHKITKAENEIVNELNVAPTAEQIAEKLGTSVEKIETVKLQSYQVTSLDKPISDDGEGTLGEFIPDDNFDFAGEVCDTLEKDQFMNVLENSDLTDREVRIITMRFGLDGTGQKTLAKVGEVFGVTKERIRQIELTALQKLRANIQIQKIWDEYGRTPSKIVKKIKS